MDDNLQILRRQTYDATPIYIHICIYIYIVCKERERDITYEYALVMSYVAIVCRLCSTVAQSSSCSTACPPLDSRTSRFRTQVAQQKKSCRSACAQHALSIRSACTQHALKCHPWRYRCRSACAQRCGRRGKPIDEEMHHPVFAFWHLAHCSFVASAISFFAAFASAFDSERSFALFAFAFPMAIANIASFPRLFASSFVMTLYRGLVVTLLPPL